MTYVSRPLPFRADAGTVTHRGRVRRSNQDVIVGCAPVFAVADGMGGHAGGEVASALVGRRLDALAGVPLGLEAALLDAIAGAHHDILAFATENGLQGMGTTVSGFAIVGVAPDEEILVFNVGDSRTYRARDGSLALLTTDHSVVQELIDSHRISPTEASSHPHRNVVTRALGDETLAFPDAIDTSSHAPQLGDRYLVCSDGLCREVADESILQVLSQPASPQTAANTLLDLALVSGARDNISVVVVDIVGAMEASRASTDDDTAPRRRPESDTTNPRPLRGVSSLPDGVLVTASAAPIGELRPADDPPTTLSSSSASRSTVPTTEGNR